MKPTDEVTITTTLGELAKVYAIMGRVTGNLCGSNIWDIVIDLLDPDMKVYDKLIKPFEVIPRIEYHLLQKEFEEALFKEKEEVLELSVAEFEEKYGCKVKIVDKQY